MYRSPSQNIDAFDLFLSNLEIFLREINKSKPSLSVVTGDFRARSFYWWCKDMNSKEGLNLFLLMSSNGLSQLINDTTYIQTSSSCIDLIFADQPNLLMNAGVHSTLHSNCHHQIVHSSFNLNIYYNTLSPAKPYQRLTWDYKKADSTKIRKALDSLNWERLFDKKELNAQIKALNETILIVFRNIVPNKYITVDDKDLVWINEIIKPKMKTKNKLYKQNIEI